MSMTAAADTAAFPKLDDGQIAQLETLAERRLIKDGDALFRAGERGFDFFVILRGGVEIIDTSGDEPRQIVTHGEREFTGDVSLLTDRPAVVSAFAAGDCEVLAVSQADLRGVLGEVPELSQLLLESFQTRRRILEASGFTGMRVLGPGASADVLQLREFLYKNKVPFTFVDTEQPDGRDALTALDKAAADTPVIACSEHVVAKPSLAKVAECLGITRDIPDEAFDMAVVGAGPAGLAAAVYAASEGLRTLVIDGVGPGGQAGTSSRIENYMGFPAGASGADLANLGFLQAVKFGAHFTAPVSARRLHRGPGGDHLLELCTGQRVCTKTVLVATGASYRRLRADGCRRLEGAGVFYSATTVEARGCRGRCVAVVGGGNSAGQAALYLAGHNCRVKLMIRGDDLGAKMSHYLVSRIERAANIEVLTRTEVGEACGDDRLRSVKLAGGEEFECSGLFVFVGADPKTDWLPDSVARDGKGFLLCGRDAAGAWPLADRQPCPVETSLPGVFAAGDVRSGSTKRVAFAVGDGAFAVSCAHEVLAARGAVKS